MAPRYPSDTQAEALPHVFSLSISRALRSGTCILRVLNQNKVTVLNLKRHSYQQPLYIQKPLVSALKECSHFQRWQCVNKSKNKSFGTKVHKRERYPSNLGIFHVISQYSLRTSGSLPPPKKIKVPHARAT